MEHSWADLFEKRSEEDRKGVEKLLSAEEYCGWLREKKLLMPTAEVMRAGVRMKRSGAIVLLHKRQVRRSGALEWDVFKKDMVLTEKRPLPWCQSCWSSLRRGRCPEMALANGLLGGREYKMLSEIPFGMKLALRRGRASVRKVFLSEAGVKRMGLARPKGVFETLMRGVEGNTVFSTRFKTYKSTIRIVECSRILVVIVVQKSASRVVTVGRNCNCGNDM